MSTFDISNPPLVYGLMGASFGDLEFDIGKSARWLEYFTDDMFVLDVNLGDPRYWIVNWAMTFPHAEHAVTGINFFTDAVNFRKEQFRLADLEYHFSDTDWILWVDGSEGLSFDTTSLPTDYNSDPFMSFIWREIERAEGSAVTDKVVLPFYAFLRSASITNVSYDHPQNPSGIIPGSGDTTKLTYSFDSTGLVFSGSWTSHAHPVTWSFFLPEPDPVIPTILTGFNVVQAMPAGVWNLVVNDTITNYAYSIRVQETVDGVPIAILQQPVSVPYYLAAQGLTRLTQVSALRNPAFNWASIDTPSTPSANVKAQIISYAYCHWNEPNIPPGATDVPPLSEANDDGYRMRKLISLVRPLAGLPTVTWNANDQPAGQSGPWAVSTIVNTHPGLVGSITGAPSSSPALPQLGIPLYDTVLRLNLRDGVWYEGDVSGNTPLMWDSVHQKWVPPYDPNHWPSQGVDAPQTGYAP